MEQTLAHRTALDEPDAPLSCSECHRPCSMARQCTVVPRSGRRGRRFKSCHPDWYPAGQRLAPIWWEPLLLEVQQQNACAVPRASTTVTPATITLQGYPQFAPQSGLPRGRP